MGEFKALAKKSQLKPNEGAVVTSGDLEIALFQVEGKVYACDNACPHRGGPLGEGSLEGKIVTCPWHGWEFNVTTGGMPVNANASIKTYAVKEEGDDVLVEV